MEEKKSIVKKLEDLLAILRRDENSKITSISYQDRDYGVISITKTGQH